MKKGVTPVISTILLVMMTVAAAGAAFYWILSVQGGLTGGSEQHAESLNEHVNSQLLIDEIQYDVRNPYGPATSTNSENLSGNITMVLSNVGAQPIPIDSSTTSPLMSIILKNKDQVLVCSPSDVNGSNVDCISGCGDGATLDAGERTTVKLSLNETCDIGNITTYPNGTLFYLNMDFSGQVGTQASFRK